MTPDRARAWTLLRAQLLEHRRAVGGAVLGGVGWQLAGIVVPIVVGWTIDHGIVDGDRSAIWAGGLALLLLGLVEAGGAALRHRMACTAFMGSSASLRSALAAAALGLDADDRNAYPPGEVLARATSDTDTVGGLYDAVGHTVAQALSIPVILVALAVIDVTMALAVAITVPVSAALVWWSSSAWERRSALAQAAGGRAIEAAEETVEGFKVLRGLGAEPAAVARFERRSEELRVRATAVGRLALGFEPALDAMSIVSVAIVLWLAGDRVLTGTVPLGGAITAVGLTLFLSGPVRVIGERILTVQTALASAARIVTVLDAGRPLDAAEADPLAGTTGATLEATGVCVQRGDATLAEAVDLVIAPGRLVVLDGPTGAGKSTLLATLAGLRPRHGGTLCLGGHDIGTWSTAALRRRAVVCGPDPFLFGGTIGDNLRFADGQAEPAQLRAALDATACDFVDGLPGGLDAELGERGVSLSGGQRQRLALARAVLARPSVLVLDGATTALDPATEAAAVAGLRAALPATGVVIVTSNPAVRAAADHVVELRDGRLAVVSA